MTVQATDIHFLQHAVRIGARNLGRTWPRPSVGCVLVKDGQVIAAAATDDTGRPHAEVVALGIAAERARGATVYTTLEPCSHHGRTPPCAEALLKAGVTRVVVAAIDPNPLVSGRGLAILRAGGVEVTEHLLPEAARLHRGFFRYITSGLPEVILKLATSEDGQMADPAGKQRWITGPHARAHGHLLRNQVDAMLTGVNTVLSDDPMLNVRLPGIDHGRLVRVVADRTLRIPLESQLVRTAEMQATWIITSADGVEQAASHASDLRERGVKLIVLDQAPSPRTMLEALGREGITRLLVEAGPTLSAGFLSEKLVDRLYWYRAPILLGSTGHPALPALHSHLPELGGDGRRTVVLGDDRCEIVELDSCLPG